MFTLFMLVLHLIIMRKLRESLFIAKGSQRLYGQLCTV